MERKKNYIIKLLDYFQCIIEWIVVKKSLVHSLQIKNSEIRSGNIKSTIIRNLKISKTDLSCSRWNDVNLSYADMKNCNIEGLRINGYLISELIKEQKTKISSSGK